MWHPQLDHFGKTRRAIAFDYPGYGDSDPAPEGTTRDDYAAAILSAMDALGVAGAHICGLSLGGVVAIAMHHFGARALRLADPRRHVRRASRRPRDLRAKPRRQPRLAAMAEARVDLLLAQPADPDVRREVVETMSRIDPAAYRIGAEAVWLADQRARAAAIRVPTLVLVGDQDRTDAAGAQSNELRAADPRRAAGVIECAGPPVTLEQTGRFNAALIDEPSSLRARLAAMTSRASTLRATGSSCCPCSLAAIMSFDGRVRAYRAKHRRLASNAGRHLVARSTREQSSPGSKTSDAQHQQHSRRLARQRRGFRIAARLACLSIWRFPLSYSALLCHAAAMR